MPFTIKTAELAQQNILAKERDIEVSRDGLHEGEPIYSGTTTERISEMKAEIRQLESAVSGLEQWQDEFGQMYRHRDAEELLEKEMSALSEEYWRLEGWIKDQKKETDKAAEVA